MTGRHKHRALENNTESFQAPADGILKRVTVGAEFSQEEKAIAWQKTLIEKEELRLGKSMTDEEKQEFIKQKRKELVSSLDKINTDDI